MTRFFNFHPPDDVRVFAVPEGSILRWDDAAVVYEVGVGEGRVLRHYSFADRWFEVNCSLDEAGRFQAEPWPEDLGPRPAPGRAGAGATRAGRAGVGWSFTCDICTPHMTRGADLFNVDLFLDILVVADGRAHLVVDRPEFDSAARLGWITPAEQEGALRGLSDLLDIVHSAGLVRFLDQIHPFSAGGRSRLASRPQQPPMGRLTVAEVPLFGKEVRAWVPPFRK